MPVHDWTRVDAGIFHAFHHDWITEISRAQPRPPAGRVLESLVRRRSRSMDQESIVRLIRSKPPRCIRRFKAELLPLREEWKDDLITEWKLVCPCGSNEGAVLGHPLGELKPGFEEVPLFVSPLAFQCARCGVATEFLDTDADGTGAELAKLEGDDIGCAAYRGEGPQQPFPCPKCGTSHGEVVITLSFNEAYIYDLEDDEIEFPFENLFSWVEVHCRCSICGERTQVTEIDTKY